MDKIKCEIQVSREQLQNLILQLPDEEKIILLELLRQDLENKNIYKNNQKPLNGKSINLGESDEEFFELFQNLNEEEKNKGLKEKAVEEKESKDA